MEVAFNTFYGYDWVDRQKFPLANEGECSRCENYGWGIEIDDRLTTSNLKSGHTFNDIPMI